MDNTTQRSIFITPAIERFDLLLPISENNSYTHPIYLIIHQLIPQDLYNLVWSFTFNDKVTRKIIWDFLLSFQEQIYQQIWPQYCSLLKIWERRNGITSKRKRKYWRDKITKKHQSTTPPTQPSIALNTLPSPQDPFHPWRRMNTIPSDEFISRTPHPWSLMAPSNRPPNLPRLPMWLILCTCNFLHSGGWLSSVRHPSSFELDIDNFSLPCNFNYNFFSSSFSLDSIFTT